MRGFKSSIVVLRVSGKIKGGEERNNFIKLLCGGVSEVAREAWHRPHLLEMPVFPGMYRAGRQGRCGGLDGAEGVTHRFHLADITLNAKRTNKIITSNGSILVHRHSDL